MIRDVLQKGSDILTKPCEVVKDINKVQGTITDLKDTIEYLKTTHNFTRGIGLAAPQIGESKRITVAEFEGVQYVLINPEIIETSDNKMPIKEGCISFFEYRANVPRYDYVKVKALNEKGEGYSVEGNGAFAMLLQHEIDHLDGILYIDHMPNKEKDLFIEKKEY